jgi:hypothetical protein
VTSQSSLHYYPHALEAPRSCPLALKLASANLGSMKSPRARSRVYYEIAEQIRASPDKSLRNKIYDHG